MYLHYMIYAHFPHIATHYTADLPSDCERVTPTYCTTLHRAATQCDRLQHTATHCNKLHCRPAIRLRTLLRSTFCAFVVCRSKELQCVAECCNVVQCITVCCSVLQCASQRSCRLLQCVAVCGFTVYWSKELHCIAACCSVVQCGVV